MKNKIFYLILVAVLVLSSYLIFSITGGTQKKEIYNSGSIQDQDKTEITLAAVGDISFSRGVEGVIKREKNSNYPFLKIKEQLLGNDIVFANLETPITEGREIQTGEMIFRSNPGTEKALRDAGFNIVSLANNHSANFGDKGLSDTFSYLKNAGINYTGAGNNETEAYNPVNMNIKGIKIAFLAYGDQTLVPTDYEAGDNHPGIAFMKTEKMAEKVKAAKVKSDLVIVSMHGGIEYENKPAEYQLNFARRAIEAGAEMVIGHHPHVVESMEKYKGKYIFYSLGNFVMDQMWSKETREGLILKAKLSKEGVKSISLIPVIIENYSQPRLATVNEKVGILKRLNFPTNNGGLVN